MEWLILSVVVVVACIALWISNVQTLVVFEHQRAVLFVQGKLVRVLEPGLHRLWRRNRKIEVLDIREQAWSVTGQEVLSSDNISVKASLAVRYRIVSPETYLRTAQGPDQLMYLEAQLALRDIVGTMPVEDLLEKRGELSTRLKEMLVPKAEALGIHLESVGIKDIMFPGSLKQIFSQVVEARKAAQASLEKARGETATLRHLANAAKMLENNPALVTLKTLEIAGQGKNTLVLGMPGPVVPLSPSPEPPAARKRPETQVPDEP